MISHQSERSPEGRAASEPGPAQTGATDLLIEIKDLSHSYRDGRGEQVPALEGISISIRHGEFVAVVGPSGCGKTTLLNIVAGLEKHGGAGTVSVAGSKPQLGSRAVGYMLARDCLLPWRRALDNAALGMETHGIGKAERLQRAREAMASVGLEHFHDAYPAQLSQGMRQRVALARVFAPKPDLLLLDEPFSALDAQTRVMIQDSFLSVWEKERTTGILVTHDLAEAVTLADRVIVMSRRPGRIRAIREIDLPRPRSAGMVRSDPRFHQIYEPLWEELRDEMAMSAQVPGDTA